MIAIIEKVEGTYNILFSVSETESFVLTVPQVLVKHENIHGNKKIMPLSDYADTFEAVKVAEGVGAFMDNLFKKYKQTEGEDEQ